MRSDVTGNESGPELLPFTPHDHDRRVERDGWVFFVRGVKKYEPLRGVAVVHKELLPEGVRPTRRIAELAEEVERGRFDA
jgi:hypothetical protein